MTAPFVHLHLHTEFSIVDSTVRIPSLIQAAVADEMPAVAMTDQGNLFGLVKFYRAAIAAGIKPIVGAELCLRADAEADRPFSLLLYCRNLEGYRSLARLLSRAYIEGQVRGVPTIDRAWLNRENCNNLIALSGGLNGDVGRALAADQEALARSRIQAWQQLFGDRYYLELSRLGRPGEEACLQATIGIAAELGIPVVASNDVRFVAAGDFAAHEARVCIHEGYTLDQADRPRNYVDQQYLKSAEEMAALFADIPEAIENSVEFARRCNLDLPLGETFLPEFPVPDGETTDSFLTTESAKGLASYLESHRQRDRLTDDRFNQMAAPYRKRLDEELQVICEMGFSGYFLIVADFIHWAKSERIPVGPGRGSGAGSLVAFVLGITDLDPLQYDLLFERFLNPERVSMPDFDVDFCMEGRDRVIEYVAKKYGRDRVSQIITFGTMAARAVIRDAGRVLGHPYGFVDKIAKQVPFEVGMTLAKALEQDEEFARLVREDEEVGALFDLARSLEGLARNAGKHAGGVVIAPSELTDFTPLYCEEGGANLVTQLDKDDVESAGLVKFDFLGLKTLTIIDWAVQTVNRIDAESDLDIGQIPMDDAKTFELLQACSTRAVFQLESRGMRDLVKRMQPDQFDDLVALVALFRPGPLQSGMVDDFLARKHDVNRADIDYLHPDLKPVLESTYGVILYQEQVMQIAQVLAGYTLGGADLLRRAMGKKKPEEMAKQREVFVHGAIERGVAKPTATRIFDLMEKFAGYGFNKSHSAAYALLSYQTAYLKAHHPAAFMAAAMSADLVNTDRLVVLKDDCRKLGLALCSPDVNRSELRFSVDDGAIVYGLGAIKGVGQAAVDSIVRERETNGQYRSLNDFCERIDLERANQRSIEAMIKSGAMDVFGEPRRQQMHALGKALQSADQQARAREAGQNDMFGVSAAAEKAVVRGPTLEEWSERELLLREKEALGLYLSGHPFNEVRADARHLVDGKLIDIASEPAPQTASGDRRYGDTREVTVAGLIMEIRKRGNRNSVILDDDSGRIEVSLFGEAFAEFQSVLTKDEIVVVSGGLRYDDFSGAWQVNGRNIVPIDRVIESRARHMILKVAPNGQGPALLNRLHDVLLPYREGPCDVAVRYEGEGAAAKLNLGPEWSVRPSRELRDKLVNLLGQGSVRILYDQGLKSR